jgi:hypothetical protein
MSTNHCDSFRFDVVVSEWKPTSPLHPNPD